MSFAQPKTGALAPTFKLKDQNGAPHSLEQYRGKTVVLEWTNPTCPFVVNHYAKKTMTKLAAAHPEVVWLTVNSSNYTTDEKNKEWAKREGVRYVLNDASGEVGRSYGAKTTPHMFVINAKGTLVYQGAIDDNPHFEKREGVNYVAQAIQDLAANRPVKRSEVRPYGCSVKYKR
jgi:peroxiredoxin